MLFWVIIFVSFVSSAEIDICVPAFPQMQAYFGLTPFTTELILGVNIFFHCIAAFFAGNLGDKYGKKIVTNYGLLLFAVSSYMCFSAENYWVLLIGRALQGIGVAMPMVLSSPIIMDAYAKEKHQSTITMFNGITTLAVCIAPLIGSYLTLLFGWRANFMLLLVLAIVALILFNAFIPNDKNHNTDLDFSLSKYTVIFKNKVTLMCIAIFCLQCGLYYGFIGLAPIIYIESFGVNLKFFGIYQGILTLSFGFASIFSGKLIKIFGKKQTFITSLTMMSVFAFLCLLAIAFNIKNPEYITAMITILSIGVAIPLNFVYVFALNSIPGYSSRISGILTVGKWISSIFVMQTASYFYTNDFRSLGWLMFVMEITVISLITYLFIKNSGFRKAMVE